MSASGTKRSKSRNIAIYTALDQLPIQSGHLNYREKLITYMGKILITETTGQIGSDLMLSLRENYGSDNVNAVGHTREPERK